MPEGTLINLKNVDGEASVVLLGGKAALHFKRQKKYVINGPLMSSCRHYKRRSNAMGQIFLILEATTVICYEEECR